MSLVRASRAGIPYLSLLRIKVYPYANQSQAPIRPFSTAGLSAFEMGKQRKEEAKPDVDVDSLLAITTNINTASGSRLYHDPYARKREWEDHDNWGDWSPVEIDWDGWES